MSEYTIEQLVEALESWPIDSNDVDDQDLLLQAAAALRDASSLRAAVTLLAENADHRARQADVYGAESATAERAAEWRGRSTIHRMYAKWIRGALNDDPDAEGRR
jgi:hypothetical protein